MNIRFKFILAVMAAGAVFASCTKDVTPPNSENDEIVQATEASRVISVSFSPQTKTTLEGFQPKFEEGDSILISNGEVLDTCEVSVNGDNTTFTTELDGLLKAVYPYKAAQIIGTEISDEVLVSTEQDGTFASAHICMAEMKVANDKSLLFENKTALFEIIPPSGATALTITSLKTVVSGSRTSGTAAEINTNGTDKTVITVGGGSTTLADTIYVALKAGVHLTDLSFDAGEAIGMKGIPTSKLGSYTDATAANTKYTINNQNWHPYVEIQMNSKTYKWARMNIGATSETDYGYYFFWGGTKGYKRNGSNWVEADATPESELTNGFAIGNDPHYDNTNSKYTKYTGTSGDNKPVLELADDAANVNWGGSWRMPTKEEFDALAVVKDSWDSNGYKFGTSPNQIFLPVAGFGSGTDLDAAGADGNYWSSSLDAGTPDLACCLNFGGGVATTLSDYRYGGQSVRALSE